MLGIYVYELDELSFLLLCPLELLLEVNLNLADQRCVEQGVFNHVFQGVSLLIFPVVTLLVTFELLELLPTAYLIVSVVHFVDCLLNYPSEDLFQSLDRRAPYYPVRRSIRFRVILSDWKSSAVDPLLLRVLYSDFLNLLQKLRNTLVY